MPHWRCQDSQLSQYGLGHLSNRVSTRCRFRTLDVLLPLPVCFVFLLGTATRATGLRLRSKHNNASLASLLTTKSNAMPISADKLLFQLCLAGKNDVAPLEAHLRDFVLLIPVCGPPTHRVAAVRAACSNDGCEVRVQIALLASRSLGFDQHRLQPRHRRQCAQ